jgi:hypothetical protein
MIVFDPDGVEIHRSEGRDFADRTHDDELWAAIEPLGLPAVTPPPWMPDETSRELAREHRVMSQSMLDAWARWEPTIPQR